MDDEPTNPDLAYAGQMVHATCCLARSASRISARYESNVNTIATGSTMALCNRLTQRRPVARGRLTLLEWPQSQSWGIFLSGCGCVKSHEAERRSQHSGFDHRLSKTIRAESGPFPKSLALWWRHHQECSNAEKEFTRERANHSSSRVTPEPLRQRVRLLAAKK